MCQPGNVVQSVGHLTEDPEVPDSMPSLATYFKETDHEIFSTVIFPLHLFLKGQLSVTVESMGT